jgi:chitinase
MAMDYYNPEDDKDMGLSAVKAAEAIKGQLDTLYGSPQPYDRVAITPMIGLNDDTNGMFKLKDAKTVQEYAADKGIGFKSFWSFNRDNPSDYSYVDLTTSSNPEQKEPGEYTKSLLD